MQDKIDLGMEKYRQAITHPRTNDTYDRARLDAYQHLIALFEKRNDLKAAEEMYRQRAEEFDCSKPDYGRFLLERRGDANQAIALARKAVDGHCQGSQVREVLGLAYYTAWANGEAAGQGEYLNQAHVYLPVGPRLLFLLAASERTAVALKKLIATGESIDQPDNRNWTALALAVMERDYSAATRLVRLGARPGRPAGPNDMPVALLPVMTRDIEGIRLMRKLGVDYSKVTYQGISILDQVGRTGDRQLLNEVDPRANRL